MGIQLWIESGSRVTVDDLLKELPIGKFSEEVKSLRNVAVDHGYAEYVVDDQGENLFRWINKKGE